MKTLVEFSSACLKLSGIPVGYLINFQSDWVWRMNNLNTALMAIIHSPRQLPWSCRMAGGW